MSERRFPPDLSPVTGCRATNCARRLSREACHCAVARLGHVTHRPCPPTCPLPPGALPPRQGACGGQGEPGHLGVPQVRGRTHGEVGQLAMLVRQAASKLRLPALAGLAHARPCLLLHERLRGAAQRMGSGLVRCWAGMSSCSRPSSCSPRCSRCGNFGCVGSEAGRLDRYNMQSGMHRGSYCRDPKVGRVRVPVLTPWVGLVGQGVRGSAAGAAQMSLPSSPPPPVLHPPPRPASPCPTSPALLPPSPADHGGGDQAERPRRACT